MINGLAPLVAYALVRPYVPTDATALTLVLVIPLADAVMSRLRGTGTDPIAVITVLAIVLSVAGSMWADGSALILKIRPSVITAVFGLACIGSTGFARPALFYVGRAFATAGNAAEHAAFDELLCHRAIACNLRQVTLAWGAGLLAQAGTNLALAVLTPTRVFLVASLVVDWTGLALLLIATKMRVRRTADAVSRAVDPAGAA